MRLCKVHNTRVRIRNRPRIIRYYYQHTPTPPSRPDRYTNGSIFDLNPWSPIGIIIMIVILVTYGLVGIFAEETPEKGCNVITEKHVKHESELSEFLQTNPVLTKSHLKPSVEPLTSLTNNTGLYTNMTCISSGLINFSESARNELDTNELEPPPISKTNGKGVPEILNESGSHLRTLYRLCKSNGQMEKPTFELISSLCTKIGYLRDFASCIELNTANVSEVFLEGFNKHFNSKMNLQAQIAKNQKRCQRLVSFACTLNHKTDVPGFRPDYDVMEDLRLKNEFVNLANLERDGIRRLRSPGRGSESNVLLLRVNNFL